MAAEGLITFDELRDKVAVLEESRETARRRLSELEGRRERLAELERDRETLMEHYAGMVPDALDTLSPEERHRVYKLLKLGVKLDADGTLEVRGTFGGEPLFCAAESIPRYHFKSTKHRELRFHTLLTASYQEPRLEWTVVDS